MNRCPLNDAIEVQEPESDEDFGQVTEPLMDVIAAIVTHTQPAELMKPANRSFHDPTIDTKTTTVGRAPFGQLRVDPAVGHLLPLLLVIKAPVADHMILDVGLGWPGWPWMGMGGAFTNGTVSLASGVFPGIVSMTKGTPWPSVTIACSLPGLERSHGENWGRFLQPRLTGADMARVHLMNRSKSIASA